MTDPVGLLKKLVSISSPSGKEFEIATFLINLLLEKRFNVQKIPVSGNRFCIYATTGTPTIVFEAHMDTVLPFIAYSEDTEYAYGRGTCDTKGAIACMLSASFAAKERGLSDFGLLFTVGEEEDFSGARKIVSTGISLPFMIVGEPTSLQIVNAHYGLFAFSVTTEGKAAHSSKPEEGVNAIELLLPVLTNIHSMNRHPESILTLAKISGGTAGNVIPDNATATFSMRVSPKDTINYKAQLSSLLNKSATITVYEQVASVSTAIPRKLSFLSVASEVKYCTELSFFQNGVIVGPGDIAVAHKKDEKVSKKELHNAVLVYTQILQSFVK